MKKERKRAPAYKALRLRLGVYALGLWLIVMSLMTWAVASDMQHQLKAEVRELVARYGAYDVNPGAPLDEPLTHRLMNKPTTPYSYIQLEPLLPFVLPHYDSISSDDPLWGKWDLYYGFEAAEIFREGGHYSNVLAKTGSTVLFDWFSESSWKQQESNFASTGYIYLPEELQDLFFDFPAMTQNALLFDALRMRGHFYGTCFIPASIESGKVIWQGDRPDTAQIMAADAANSIIWSSQYEAAEEDPNAVTIYCTHISAYVSSLRPVEVNGKRYADIAEAYLSGDFENNDSLICTQYIYSGPTSQDGQSLYYNVLVRAWPLEYAFWRLWPTYLVSALLLLVGLWLFSWRIRRSLTTPLTQLTQWELADVDKAWQEPYELQQLLTDTRRSLAETKTELKQTQTALEYAQNAEEHRKMLISSIAHELKTPLAVIHSYAEGLQEGIAPDRQAHYLSIILSETERMDEMVLQMLDLSRLEAGKVRLTTEEVELLALTEGVVKKLAPLWEAKELTIHYPLVSTLQVMADEARMEQVLTNLIGNAIKYSPPGSRIQIKLFRHDRSAHFRIQNEAPHLSEEARQRVWDSFYRADPSRTEPGTGLGLALVKRIIDLHRGSCSVQNTRLSSDPDAPTALEFGFTLPVS